jgi:hypothetical protein
MKSNKKIENLNIYNTHKILTFNKAITLNMSKTTITGTGTVITDDIKCGENSILNIEAGEKATVDVTGMVNEGTVHISCDGATVEEILDIVNRRLNKKSKINAHGTVIRRNAVFDAKVSGDKSVIEANNVVMEEGGVLNVKTDGVGLKANVSGAYVAEGGYLSVVSGPSATADIMDWFK